MSMQELSRFSSQHYAVRWLIWGVLLFVSGFLWSPSRDGLDVIFVLGVFVPLIILALTKRIQFDDLGGVFTLLACGYAGFTVLASLWGNPKDLKFFFIQFLVLLSWFVAANIVITRSQFNFIRIFNLVVGIAALVGVSSIALFYSENPLGARLVGWSVARNPLVLAEIFGCLSIMCLALSFQSTTWQSSMSYFFCTILLFIPVALTQSRGPVLSFIIMGLVALCIIKPNIKFLLTQFSLVAIGVIGLVVATDLVSILTERGLSFSFRDVIWKDVLTLSKESPIWGSGVMRDDHLTLPSGYFHHPHNAWLDIFYRTGFVGLGLILTYMFLVVKAFRPTKELTVLYIWLGFGCLCLFTNSRMLFWELNAKWFLFWIPAAIITGIHYRDYLPKSSEQ